MTTSPSRSRVTLKLATSLDGRIATAAGESRWITGPAARAMVHQQRAAHDAVLIGIGTALADDPELTARTEPAPSKQPLRVVLDRHSRLPVASKLAKSVGLGPVVALSTGDWPQSAPLDGSGVERLLVKPAQGEDEIAAALRALAQAHGVERVYVEGGGQVAGAFLRAGLVDRIEWFRAPILLGEEGRPAVGPLALAALADAPRFVRVAASAIGPDLWERYEREHATPAGKS